MLKSFTGGVSLQVLDSEICFFQNPPWLAGFSLPKRNGPAQMRQAAMKLCDAVAYFNEVLIVVNVVFSVVPNPLTAAIMASAMPAAIKPYSMAVAPD
jgi:hypothetical protein